MRITYLTEDPATDYARDISQAATVVALRRILSDWKLLAPDAVKVAKTMTEADWPEYAKGLRIERTGEYAGVEWANKYGAILVPEKMLQASMVADTYKVPWGTAWIRLREATN